MNKKLILELLEKGRISVDETLALLGETQITQSTTAPLTACKKKDHRTISNGQHHQIVRAYKAERSVLLVSINLGINEVTVRDHLKYAGLLPANSEIAKQKVKIWRERRNLYLESAQNRAS